jgi:hypothetical protein
MGDPQNPVEGYDHHADSVMPATKCGPKTHRTKRAAPSPHPHFENADIDHIHYHRYLPEARRQTGILFSLAEPKLGIFKEEKIRKLAYKDPVHVVKARGEILCFGGVTTLEEARNTLIRSRTFPVLVYPAISHQDVVEQVLLDQLCPIIRGCTRIKPLKKLIGLVVAIAVRFPAVFAKHTKSDWARLFCRTERSFTMPGGHDEKSR